MTGQGFQDLGLQAMHRGDQRDLLRARLEPGGLCARLVEADQQLTRFDPLLFLHHHDYHAWRPERPVGRDVDPQ